MPEELRAEALKNRDRLSSGNRVELETIRQRKDGVRFDVSVVAKGHFAWLRPGRPSTSFIEILPTARKQKGNLNGAKQICLKVKDWCTCAVGRTTRYPEW